MNYELSNEKGDEAIAIYNTKKKDKLLYYKATQNLTPKKEFFLTGNEKLLPLMNRQEGGFPNRVFIAGGTLQGKSYIASKLAGDYHKLFPNNKIILFSWVADDENYRHLAKLKMFHKMRIDESILDNPISLDELHDSVCIFDDIEHFPDKEIRNELERLRDSCVNAGRHANIDVIVCRQNLLEGPKTKTCLNSSFQVVGFPHSSSRYQLGEFLKRHMHMSNAIIQKILNVPSRWVLINRNTPSYVLYERGCFILI